jgi:transporter family-2 protein
LNSTIFFGVLAALLTGIAISVQSTITSRAGALIGDMRTGLLTNSLGGLIAAVLVLILITREGFSPWKVSGSILGFVAFSGLLGIFIITGISYSLQRTGVAAGLATIILGQLILSVVFDRLGIGAAGVIPISVERLLGLLIIAGGVYLLLPRT